MKISQSDATIIARVFERYTMYCEFLLEHDFSSHQEKLNKSLFVETVEDLAIIAKLYPIFADGRAVRDGVAERLSYCRLPEPKIDNNLPPAIESVGPTEDDIRSLLG